MRYDEKVSPETEQRIAEEARFDRFMFWTLATIVGALYVILVLAPWSSALDRGLDREVAEIRAEAGR